MPGSVTDNLLMCKSFGEILKNLIEQHHITVRKFADGIGVSPQTANEWLGKQGRFPNSPDILKKVSNYFDISVHELLFGEPDPKSLIGSILEKTEIHSGYYKLTVERIHIDPCLIQEKKKD